MARLLAGKADPNAADAHGVTVLQWAARRGAAPLVHRALDCGGAVDAADGEGVTALSAAARGGHASVVEALLARRADPGSADASGATPLLWASRRGGGAVTMLLGAGASATVGWLGRRGPALRVIGPC